MKLVFAFAAFILCAFGGSATFAQGVANCPEVRALGASAFNCNGVAYERQIVNGRPVYVQVEEVTPQRYDELRYLEQAEEEAREQRRQYNAMIGSSLPYGRRGYVDRGYLNCDVIANRYLEACIELRRQRDWELRNPGNPCISGMHPVACDRWRRGVFGTNRP